MLLAQIRCSFLSGVYPEVPVWTFTPLTSMPEDEILSIFPPVSVYSIPSHPCFSSPIRCFINPFTDKGRGVMRFIAYTCPLEHTHSNWSQGRHAVSVVNKTPLPGSVILGLLLLSSFIIYSYIFEIIYTFHLFYEVTKVIFSGTQIDYIIDIYCVRKN